ncbi:hypothetical protein [Rhizobium sp. BK176]|uniref:hypothetical protein n=1 Tax=Rhizobium sp. BK176 TaxID=2587071 RepID=UPI002168505A|nr:hypothetical protein [Rhizobium sp. BK176]MCS4090118.1 hypothetical protein [Rhizobium sp. BK176]
MKVELRYPVIFRHSPNSRQLERHHVRTRTAVVEVEEVDVNDAPVVFSWSNEGRDQSGSYRLVDGVLYGQVSVASKRAACKSALTYPTAPMVERAVSVLADIAMTSGSSMVVPPTGFFDPSKWTHLDEFPSNSRLEDIAAWEVLFADCARRMAVIDGGLWREFPDPLVLVYRNTAGWQTSVVHEVSYAQDLQRFHFSADRWQDAQDFCRQMAQAADRPAFEGRFTYDPIWGPSGDANAVEIRELAERLEHHVSKTTNEHASTKQLYNGGWRPKVTWGDLPTDLFCAYAALRSLLDVPVDMFGEREAGEALDCFERLVSISERKGLGWLALQPEAYRAHIEKWHARPIKFEMTAARSQAGERRP